MCVRKLSKKRVFFSRVRVFFLPPQSRRGPQTQESSVFRRFRNFSSGRKAVGAGSHPSHRLRRLQRFPGERDKKVRRRKVFQFRRNLAPWSSPDFHFEGKVDPFRNGNRRRREGHSLTATKQQLDEPTNLNDATWEFQIDILRINCRDEKKTTTTTEQK